jgi:hypothetical protein
MRCAEAALASARARESAIPPATASSSITATRRTPTARRAEIFQALRETGASGLLTNAFNHNQRCVGCAITGRRTGGTRSSRSISWVTSMRLPPVSVQASGTPPLSTSRWCLLPARPLSTGLRPVCAPLFCLDVAGVGDRPLPLELLGGVQLGQQQLVQPFLHAGLLPGPQPAPGRHAAAEAEGRVASAPSRSRWGAQTRSPATPADHRTASDPDTETAAASSGSNGSTRSHNPSGTSHGFALIDTLPNLTTGADGLRC